MAGRVFLETDDDVAAAFRGRIGEAPADAEGALPEHGAFPLSDAAEAEDGPPGDGTTSGPDSPSPAVSGALRTGRILSGRTGLSREYEIRETRFDGIDLDPPKGGDFWELGDLAIWVTPEKGPPQLVEDLEILRRYSERIVSVPGSDLRGPEIVAALAFADARLVARTVRGFFYGGGRGT